MAPSISAYFGDTLQTLRPTNVRATFGSVRGVVFILGKLALFGAVGFTYLIGDMLRNAADNSLPDTASPVTGNRDPKKGADSLANYQVILTAPIFGRTKVDATPAPKPTTEGTLKIRVVAINELSRGARMVILEDSAKQAQDVFELNDSVFGQGKLVEIGSDLVKIEHGGRIEVVRLDDSAPKSSGGAPETATNEQTDFSVPEDELSAALANLPQLLSQARAVPYFRNGQSIGMRLFAIRSGSMYEKLGLKNGDIILSVNENSLSDPAQALKLFEQLKNERSIGVRLERNGQNMDMRYNIR